MFFKTLSLRKVLSKEWQTYDTLSAEANPSEFYNEVQDLRSAAIYSAFLTINSNIYTTSSVFT